MVTLECPNRRAKKLQEVREAVHLGLESLLEFTVGLVYVTLSVLRPALFA